MVIVRERRRRVSPVLREMVRPGLENGRGSGTKTTRNVFDNFDQCRRAETFEMLEWCSEFDTLNIW